MSTPKAGAFQPPPMHRAAGRKLETEESKEVFQKDGGSESKGHESGRKIVEILEKNKYEYTATSAT